MQPEETYEEHKDELQAYSDLVHDADSTPEEIAQAKEELISDRPRESDPDGIESNVE